MIDLGDLEYGISNDLFRVLFGIVSFCHLTNNKLCESFFLEVDFKIMLFILNQLLDTVNNDFD
jgi:hypothetical protein